MLDMSVGINLYERVAIVTGASSGMGRAAALRLAEAGASVVVGGRDSERAQGTVDAIVAAGGRAIASVGDVADSAYATVIVARAVAEFGCLDILVNGAGVNHRRTAEHTTDEDWRWVMSVNVDGVFYMSRAAVPALRESDQAAIINISSNVGLVGAAGMAAYATSKGAVTNLTRAMALDHAAEGINVNAVCPAGVDTPMLWSGHGERALDDVMAANLTEIPQGRLGQPDDIANLVLFLASDLSRHITGATFRSTEGRTPDEVRWKDRSRNRRRAGYRPSNRRPAAPGRWQSGDR